MSNDITDRNLVIGLFIFFFIYLAFVREKLNVTKDLGELKCNPLYLFMSSVILSNNESINNFQNCVNETTINTLDSELIKSRNQQLDFANKITSFTNDINNSNIIISKNISTLNTSLINLSTQISNISQVQKISNTNMSNYYNDPNSKINQFTTKINDFMSNMQSYLPSIS